MILRLRSRLLGCAPVRHGAHHTLRTRVMERLGQVTSGEICRENSTFVSRHVELRPADVTSFLDQKGMAFRLSGAEVVVKQCPFCHDTKNKADNMWKLSIGLKRGGAWICHRCGASGSWYDLKRRTGNGTAAQTSAMPTALQTVRDICESSHGGSNDLSSATLVVPDQQRVRTYPVNLMSNQRFAHVREYLSGNRPGQRGLQIRVLIKYGVGCALYRFPAEEGYEDAECITFPWVVNKNDLKSEEVADLDAFMKTKYGNTSSAPDGVVVRVKARAVNNKRRQRLDPAGGRWGIFGLHTVPDDATAVVVTEGEFDAMAVYQATGVPAVSLPNGASSLPLGVLPLLERFEKIYLWMDDDAPGQAGVEKFVKKLGVRRCLVVRPKADDPKPPKDANEALMAGRNLQEFLDGARIRPHDDIVTFQDLRHDVLHEFQNPQEYVGTALRSFPRLTRIVKGLRGGELTVITGPTGSGKTTILSQLSLDLAEGGVNTLWGSFEVKNTRLMHKMLQQFAGKPAADLRRHPEALSAWADRFQSLPLKFMRFHGGTDVDDVLDAMDYTVYAYDVQHIILDNLQFMLTTGADGSGRRSGGSFDKFDAQDVALDKFRKFATERNVHIALVIHPRKEDEGHKLTTSSIFGSAKATQEADLVIILQNQGGIKSLEVKKNRFDGDVGEVRLSFDPLSARLRELVAS